MFDFFRRKTTTEAVTPIEVYAFLVEAAKEMASSSTELMAVECNSADGLRKEYQELVALGLSGTKNAKVLKERLDAVDAYNEDIKRASEIIDYIKRVNRLFGGKSFLVSKEKFKEVCNRNKLHVGLLTEYNGVIPSRNISEIADAKKAFAEFYENDDKPFIPFKKDKYNLYVKEVHVEDNRFAPILLDYLKENGNILPVFYYTSVANQEVAIYSSSFLIDSSLDQPRNFTYVKGYAINNDTLLIACPKEYLNNPDVVVSRRPVDPIVFQYCPYGVLVHSVWGEEADDKVLREYMEFNKLV